MLGLQMRATMSSSVAIELTQESTTLTESHWDSQRLTARGVEQWALEGCTYMWRSCWNMISFRLRSYFRERQLEIDLQRAQKSLVKRKPPWHRPSLFFSPSSLSICIASLSPSDNSSQMQGFFFFFKDRFSKKTQINKCSVGSMENFEERGWWHGVTWKHIKDQHVREKQSSGGKRAPESTRGSERGQCNPGGDQALWALEALQEIKGHIWSSMGTFRKFWGGKWQFSLYWEKSYLCFSESFCRQKGSISEIYRTKHSEVNVKLSMASMQQNGFLASQVPSRS